MILYTFQTQELMRNIQQEFDRVVEEHDWVDEKTAYLIKKKVKYNKLLKAHPIFLNKQLTGAK